MEDGQRSNSVLTESDHSREEGMSCGLDVEPEVASLGGQKQKVNMKKLQLAIVAASLAGVMSASAAITIGVTPSSGPNGNGSPNYSGYAGNAIYALENGLASYGNPSSPSYYTQAPAVMSVLNNIVTGFPSWNGVANPSGAYASELGNRLLFGLDVRGNGTKISIDQLSFVMSSTDGNTLGFSFVLGSYAYSSQYVGWNYGADGIRGNADDVFITSGAASQQVDELVGRGSGNAWAVYVGDYPGTLQDGINQAAADLGSSPIDFTGTYTLGGVQGSATVTLEPVPEPTTFIAGALLLLPFGASTVRILRRNRTA
jgi:hypothetical protein